MKVKDLASTSGFMKRPGGYERSVIFNSDDLSSNTRVQVVKVPPKGTIKPHLHQRRTEVFLILSGQGFIKVGGRKVSDKNQAVLCQPEDIHEVENTSDSEDFEILVFRTNDVDDDIQWVEDERDE